MTSPTGILVVVFLLTCLEPVTVHGLMKQYESSNGYTSNVLNDGVENHSLKFRDKRTISVAARGILGLAALRRLLTGTTTAKSRKKEVNLYIKLGTGKTALEDFYSVKPVDVREITDGFRFGSNHPMLPIYTGIVGDRRLRLLLQGNRGEGLPILEIHRIKPGYKSEKIVYKPNDD